MCRELCLSPGPPAAGIRLSLRRRSRSFRSSRIAANNSNRARRNTRRSLEMEHLSRFASHVRGEFSKVIVGQSQSIEELLLVLVGGGHALIEGVPGIAKTLAAKTLARICGFEFQRVQCTADLMPADVMGTNIFNMATSSFSLHRGPIFTDLLLVDEINRTSPRTQAALLEAMEERQVTIDGTRYPLSENFTVLATQNPIEFEGTYPLPEAQLDRFSFKNQHDVSHCGGRDGDSLSLQPGI